MRKIAFLVLLALVATSVAATKCRIKYRSLVELVDDGIKHTLMPGVEASVVAIPHKGVHDVTAMHITFQGQAYAPPHRHPHSDEIIYVIQGRGETTIWELGTPEPVHSFFGRNDTIIQSAASIHDFRCTSYTCEVMIYWTHAPVVFEAFDEWPSGSYENFEDHAGTEVPFAPFAECPPGYEPDN